MLSEQKASLMRNFINSLGHFGVLERPEAFQVMLAYATTDLGVRKVQLAEQVGVSQDDIELWLVEFKRIEDAPEVSPEMKNKVALAVVSLLRQQLAEEGSAVPAV